MGARVNLDRQAFYRADKLAHLIQHSLRPLLPLGGAHACEASIIGLNASVWRYQAVFCTQDEPWRPRRFRVCSAANEQG